MAEPGIRKVQRDSLTWQAEVYDARTGRRLRKHHSRQRTDRVPQRQRTRRRPALVRRERSTNRDETQHEHNSYPTHHRFRHGLTLVPIRDQLELAESRLASEERHFASIPPQMKHPADETATEVTRFQEKHGR